ncbi:uncharacterized protein LOC124405849 [Diprion similis]|uniref:uncharacterized protein LOC124405849 n=1 Tax=Diprion similis TaxID=362088 RepID=UPI001EF79953|nr:uncharacterized protein LOC124405849 [Diprion similis]XP_046737055.1 uncharacterized protein LOC124405849 [Diprion similis]
MMIPALENDHNYAREEKSSKTKRIESTESRCSTPIFDHYVVSHSMPWFFGENKPRESETEAGYRDWKRRLHRQNLRNFKIRGLDKLTIDDIVRENNGEPTNCSMISGHFRLKGTPISGRTIVRPTPVREMWFPTASPGICSPGVIYNHYQNSAPIPIPHPQPKPEPNFTPSTSAFFNAAAGNCILPNFNEAFPNRCNYPGYMNQYPVNHDPRKLPFVGPVSKPVLMCNDVYLPPISIPQPMGRHLYYQNEPPAPTPTTGYYNAPTNQAN